MIYTANRREIPALAQRLADEIVELRQQLVAKIREAARWKAIAQRGYTVDDLTKHRAQGYQAALEATRDRVMSLEPKPPTVVAPARAAFRNGHAQARYAARDLITKMLQEHAEA